MELRAVERDLSAARSELDRCKVAAEAAARHLGASEASAADVEGALAPKAAELAKLEKEVKKLSGTVRSRHFRTRWRRFFQAGCAPGRTSTATKSAIVCFH